MQPTSAGISTVVIAAFDAADTLAATLDSILGRLQPDDEVLVCDDGSRDATAAIAREHPDPRVRLLPGAHAGTPSVPRNRGIEAARGDVVFFVDADDVARGDKFALSRRALDEHPDAAMVFTDFRRVDTHGTVLEDSVLARYELAHATGEGLVRRLDPVTATRLLARENYVGTSGVAIRTAIVRALGGFDETLTNSEDRDLWFRVAETHPLVFVDEALHDYNTAPTGITGRTHARNAPARIEVFRRRLQAPLDDEHARDLRASMAACLDAVAYEAFLAGDMDACRHHAWHAWRLQPQRQRLRRLGLSLLGKRLVAALRRLRG